MQAMQAQKRQAFGHVNGNTMPVHQMQQGPIKASIVNQYTNNGYQPKGHAQPSAQKPAPQQQPIVLQQRVFNQAPRQEEQMMIIEVVRPSKADTVHAEVARGIPMRGSAHVQVGSAPAQGACTTHASAQSDVSVGKTISIKETTYIKGPMTAQTGSFELLDVKAKVQIQPPTPFALNNNRRMAPMSANHRLMAIPGTNTRMMTAPAANSRIMAAPTATPAPPALPAEAQHSMQSAMVEQWLANQQPPAPPRSDKGSEKGDAVSTRSHDIQSVYDFEVTNTGSSRNSFNKMPAPGTFMDGAEGEGPGLVC